jgi:hypothetical protein
VPSRLDGGCIGPAEQYLLSRVDGRASARSMIERARLPAADLERSLLGLLCTGLLRFPTPPPPKPRPPQ